MTVETPQNVSTSEAVHVAEEKTQHNTATDVPKLTQDNTKSETPASVTKVSPAQDLRNIQTLLVMGVYPGQAAPEICKAYQLLEKMAQKIEAEAVKGE